MAPAQGRGHAAHVQGGERPRQILVENLGHSSRNLAQNANVHNDGAPLERVPPRSQFHDQSPGIQATPTMSFIPQAPDQPRPACAPCATAWPTLPLVVPV